MGLQKKTKALARTENALKEEERCCGMIAELRDYAIIFLSTEGIIESWNKGAEIIKGYTAQEALGKHFRFFYTPEDQAASVPEKLIQAATDNGKANHEGCGIRKDDSRFWASICITALHDNQQRVIGFSQLTRELTQERANELKAEQFNQDLKLKNELLRQSEERYHRMISEVEDYVIILLDLDGNIQNWNKGAEKIKGYSAEEIIGKHFSIFYSPKDRKKRLPETFLAEAFVNGKAIHDGWRFRKDGSAFWGSVVITALHNDAGTIIGFTKVTRDLTEKKIAEDKFLATTALKLKEKNKALERINKDLSSFAYISSHDLQEPLRKIQTFSNRRKPQRAADCGKSS